jgi:uncharacterized membrane protein
MQESLHTISPLTSPMDQMKSKRNIMIALIVLVVLVAGGAIWYTLYLKNSKPTVTLPLTPEQKMKIVADMKFPEASLTPEQKMAIVKTQTKEVQNASTLTPEEKAEIIKQMNTR